VTEGRVPDVVGQADRLGQRLVQREGVRDRAADLCHLEGVAQPGHVVVAVGVEEHLGLVLQPAEGLAVQDPIPVPLVGRAVGVLGFHDVARSCLTGPGGDR